MRKILQSGIFWTILTALISIILAIALYKTSKKEREIVYYLKNEPSKIYDNTNASSRIKLISNDTTIIKENVYVSNLVLWNRGQLEIKKTDIRKPFTIKEKNKAKIIDYKIVNSTKPEISKFILIPKDSLLFIDWDFFDPNFGLELQVIYSGNNMSQVIIDGYVLGSGIKEIELKSARTETRIKYFVLFSFFLAVAIPFYLYYISKKIPNLFKKWELIVFITFFACFSALTGYAVYEMFINGYNSPF